ncbi:hypothetical protein O181_099167 [Austropuccinia psidii MF-1]|uniref:Uncharacterized protein n=1 Tax=Austropuccinia psidii MF-1 TaxID=1389203 RepID=A0A9Q3JBT2_9BASI|nr:hypothetical protein [Austropuccinia psidii MF-1]
MLEKGPNPILPEDTLRKDLIHIQSKASSFKIILDKVKHHAEIRMNDAFDYAKQKWEKSNKVPELKAGHLVLVSTLNFKNIKSPKRLKSFHVGLFFIVALHRTDEIKVEFNCEWKNKHLTFPVILIKPLSANCFNCTTSGTECRQKDKISH